jgi:autotransporter-associated beta strand protein
VGSASTANLVLLASGQLATSAAVTLNADGRLALNDFSTSINTVTGTGLIDLATSGYLTLGAANGSSSFSGSITGTGTLEKAGTGTLTFNSNVSFLGSLTLSGGTLALNGITLSVGTLHITGVTVLDFGNSTASTLNATTFIIDAGASLTINNWVNAVDLFHADAWTGATPDTSGSAPMNRVTFTGNPASATHWQNYDKQITPVPEPAVYGAAMAGAALSAVLWRRRRVRCGEISPRP